MDQNDQNTLYLYFILLAFFALYFGLVIYDSKVLGMSFETTIELAHKFCDMHWDCDKHTYRQDSEYRNGQLMINNIFDDLLKQQNILDFLKNRSLTVRFLLYFFSPSSFEIWIKKQKKICLSRLYKISNMIEKILTNSNENACNFWIYIQDLVKNKTHHRECNICYRERQMIVAVCGHSICLPCFERMKYCPFCRMSIDHSKLITLEEANKNGIPVY